MRSHLKFWTCFLALLLGEGAFAQKHVYRYAASAIEENGVTYEFYCGNTDQNPDREMTTDYILSRRGDKNGSAITWHESTIALSPGPRDDLKAWDRRHVCDPEVIAGEFHYKGPDQKQAEVFHYALFYTGVAGEWQKGSPNQVGWALAKSLDGPWHKVEGRGPLIHSTQTDNLWGVGQPSATSINGKGRLLLFYTKQIRRLAPLDSEPHTYRVEVDLSDANNPILLKEAEVPLKGLVLHNGDPDNVNHGGAFIYDNALDRFYLIRNGHPNPAITDTPNFRSKFLQIASIDGPSLWSGQGEWTIVANIGWLPENPKRIFDGGWIRNKFGGVLDKDWIYPLASIGDSGCEGKDPDPRLDSCDYTLRYKNLCLRTTASEIAPRREYCGP